jgi:hypothetical protein
LACCLYSASFVLSKRRISISRHGRAILMPLILCPPKVFAIASETMLSFAAERSSSESLYG